MLRTTIIAVLATVICFAPASAQEKTAKKPKPRHVKVERVKRRVLIETITTSGTAAAVRRSRLNFQVPGVVSEVLVEMSERVSKGQPLARLDDANYKLYVEQAQAQRDTASAALDKLKKGFRQEEIAQAQAGVEAARAALDKFTTGFRPEEVKAAQAGLAAAQAGCDQARRNFDRMKKLFEDKKAVAEATYEQAKTQFEVAKARRDQAEQKLKTLRAGYEQADIENLRARFKQAAEQLALLKKGFRQEDITAAQAQVKVAQAALKIAQKKRQDTELQAPYDAVVVRTYKDPGEGVSTMPGQVAVEIMDISSLEVVVPVADVWAAKLTGDAYAVVDLDGGPKGLKAALKAISSAIDPASRAFPVKLVLKNPDLKLKAGMFARVKIIYSEITALAVPSKAVQEDEAGKYVMVHENGLAVRVPVETGITSEGYTQITKGLAEGRPVICEGNFGLANHARVELSKEEEKSGK